MKSKVVLAVLLLIFSLISCTSDNVSSEDEQSKLLEIVKTSKGGCFTNHNISKKSIEIYGDTLFYSIVNDTLVLTVNMLNNCASCLVDSFSIDDSTVNIFITNNCSPAANCLCNFKFNYYFENFNDKQLLFSVYLKDYEEVEFLLWNDLQYP